MNNICKQCSNRINTQPTQFEPGNDLCWKCYQRRLQLENTNRPMLPMDYCFNWSINEDNYSEESGPNSIHLSSNWVENLEFDLE